MITNDVANQSINCDTEGIKSGKGPGPPSVKFVLLPLNVTIML